MEHSEAEGQSLIQRALQMEHQFAENIYNGSDAGPPMIVLPGDVPIVVSSPHAVNHPRDGRVKLADTFTGTLALQLASLTGVSALVYARMSEEDPNYDTDGPYKRQLASLIMSTRARFVLDLHGMNLSRPTEIAIGTDHGRTLGQQKELLTTLVQVLVDNGFTNMLIDDASLFNASRPTTITSFTWRELGICAIQLEIHKKYRDAENAPYNYLKMLYALCDGLYTIQQMLEHIEGD